MKNNKSKGIEKILYFAGTAVLIIMVAFSVFNFIRDARVLKLPVLFKASDTVKNAGKSEAGDYKTLKYKKPSGNSSPKATKSTATQKSTAPETTAASQTTAAEVTKAPEP